MGCPGSSSYIHMYMHTKCEDSCFGVRVSVMFHFMFVHNTFSSAWVAEWPPFGQFWEIAARSVSNLFSLYFVYL